MDIIERFNKVLNEIPYKEVLISGEIRFSVKDIEELSNYIAYEITRESTKEIIPFYVEETVYVLPIVLGIIKSGKIPLPITSSLPLEKSLVRISDIDYDVVICDKRPKYDCAEKNILILPKEIPRGIEYSESRQLKNRNVYIICTSGTTGIPKKVFLTVDNLCWLLDEFYKIVNFTNESRFLFTTPYTFDVSLTEIFAPIFTGGTLVCYGGKSNGLFEIEKIIVENQITHLSLSPSFAETIVDTSSSSVFDRLKALCLAGEVFPSSLANRLRPTIRKGCRIFNLYGPSETTIYATYYELIDKEYSTVPIGKPIPGVTIEVHFDEDCAEGKQGELWIGGKGVTDGYLLDPLLCNEKFVKTANDRFYKTGDYVYYSGDDLVFGSRIDSQVQINGIRVELDAIKSIVDGHTKIHSSRVAFYKKKLYIFYMAKEDLKKDILSDLPSYLKPIIVNVDNYLLNQSRKLDVEAMIEKYYFKKNHAENEGMIEIIREKLSHYGCVEVADLDSLDLVRFFLDIEDTYNIEINYSDIYKLKSINNIADYISNAMNGGINEKATVEGTDKIDLINIEYTLLNRNLAIGGVELLTTPTQERLFKNGQYRTIYFDIPFNDVSCKEIIKFRNIIKQLSKRIDIFRMIAHVYENKLSFRVISSRKNEPCILLLNQFPKFEELQKIIEQLEWVIIPIIIVSAKNRAIRFYFPYHSIDASSVNMLQKTILDEIAGKSESALCKKSSLVQFEKYKAMMVESELIKNAMDLFPVTQKTINTATIRDGIQIIKIPLIGDYTKENAYLNSVYIMAKCIISEYDLTNISGGMSYDLRNYKNYKGEGLIGDVHKKIPFEVRKNDSYEDFKACFYKILDLYRNGIDYYEIAHRRSDSIGEKARKFIRTLSISINFLGEILNPEKTKDEIVETKFEKNFINIFTHKGDIYAVICSQIFSKPEYILRNMQDKLIITVKTELNDRSM